MPSSQIERKLTKYYLDFRKKQYSEIFKKNGFHKVEYRNLSGGIAAIHSGWKI